MTKLDLTQGKTPREQLELPPLYFVAMDDWVDKIGDKALVLYLRLWTLADRTNKERDNDVIPQSIGKLSQRVGMTKATFYKHVKTLYEYALIDFITYEDSKQKGNAPENIVVFKYPQNDFTKSVQPLEKVREWEDRTNEKFSYTKKRRSP
ncbi:transcriptional regulator [Geomicrobium sp. JCM 19055]|uniref:transcriptional regulator n=1 Tax=Geomicrobium sp. JCM 19055 TaxID=1460649 RepID=UPI00045ED897|nr:transcriptional regulator [Geomicrobium sp. JCM 19055]GAK00898.1 hypothetical protein JCM19055_4021 [Geomicrobium sp. JCM 19055]